MFYYSKSTKGFYTEDIHGDNMPSDVVEITVEQHQNLMAGQAIGKEITPDKNGNPVLTDPVVTQDVLDFKESQKSAMEKLTALGLTPDEIEAVLGIKS